METFIWRLQMIWYYMHGSTLWPLYAIGLVVGLPLAIIYHSKLIYVVGRLLEIGVYAFGVHMILYVTVKILNWLIEWTTDPLMPTAGRTTPIEMPFLGFAAKHYDPTGLAWFERVIIAVIAFVVLKFRYTYKRGPGG